MTGSVFLENMTRRLHFQKIITDNIKKKSHFKRVWKVFSEMWQIGSYTNKIDKIYVCK